MLSVLIILKLPLQFNYKEGMIIPVTSNFRKSLMSGGLWAVAGKFTTSFLTLAINAFLARMLAAEEVGVYFLAFNIAMFGAYLGTFGFEQTVVRFIAESIGRNELKNITYIIKIALTATTAGAICTGVIYFFSSNWIAFNVFSSIGLSSIKLVMFFWIIANSFQVMLGETFRGFQDIRYASIFGGILSTIIFVTSLVSIYFMDMTVTLSSIILLWVVSLTLSNSIGLAVLWKKVRVLKRGPNTNPNRTLSFKKMLETGMPLFAVSISTFILSQCDLWIIGGVGGDEDLAIYGAAAKLTMLMSMPLLILNSVVPPMIAEKHAQGEVKSIEATLRIIATLAFMPTLCFLLVFIVFGKSLLSLVYGSPMFGSGAHVLIIMGLKQLACVSIGATSSVLAMGGKQKELMRITLWTGLFSIILSLILGSYLTGIGVAIGFLIPICISQILLVLTAKKSMEISAYIDVLGTIRFVKTFIHGKKSRMKMDYRY